MNNNGNFSNNSPAALMSFPFPMPNPPQHPSLMDQSYLSQPPQPFQHPPPPRFYNQRLAVCLIDYQYPFHFFDSFFS